MSNDKDRKSDTESAETPASHEASASDGPDTTPPTDNKVAADSSPGQDTAAEQATEKRTAGGDSGSTKSAAESSPTSKDQSGSSKASGTAPTKRRTSPKPWGLWLTIGVLLLVLGGASGAGWWGWQQWQVFNDDWQASQQTWNEERSALAEELDSLSSRFDQRDGAVESLADDIESTREELINLATQVNEQAALQDSDIQRLEVEYLMRTARHVSQLTGDLEQALTLLQQADRMLAEFDDLAYLRVRQALALDIQSLRDVPQPDINGLYFELQALATRSREWQWWPDTSTFGREETADDEAAEQPPASTWYQQLGHELRDLVTIRYRDGDATQRLDPEAFNQMQGQFRLLTQQAQVALLQRNQTLYNASLDQAMDWLQSGAGQVPQAQLIIEQLQRLRAITVEVEVPDIDRGLNRLQAMTQQDEDNGSDDGEEPES